MDSIESHLAHCDRCLSALESFDESSDTIVQTLSTVPGVPEDEPEFRRMQQALLADPEPITDALTKTVPLIEPMHVMERSLPQQLGNYELTALIGRGATGAVYEARHVKLGRRVAIKVLSARHAPLGSEVVQRFLREMKGIGKLDHPNIIRATDAGDEDGRHFLVMEYVEGIDLSRLLRIVGRLRVADACELARQTAEALGFAHQHNLVHRDVKPSNILLTTAGQIKLLDLGLVAFLDESTRLGTLDTDVPHGTADYMPPEQWTDFAKVDARSDFYSLGCTFFRLLTGHAPYSQYAPEYSSKMDAHRNAPIPQIRELRPEVPLGVQKLLTRLLAKNPSDRFETADEIIAQLQNVCARLALAGTHQLDSCSGSISCSHTVTPVRQTTIGSAQIVDCGRSNVTAMCRPLDFSRTATGSGKRGLAITDSDGTDGYPSARCTGQVRVPSSAIVLWSRNRQEIY